MEYFSGIFDAEGCVQLCPKGSFTTAIEISNEEIPIMFKDKFGGCIYSRERIDRKKTWTWRINSISDQVISFIDSISEYSITKKPQLICLKSYLSQSRADRKSTRREYFTKIKNLKNPVKFDLEQIRHPVSINPEPWFFKWFSGFIDGDGSISCYEYKDNRNDKKYFSRRLSLANVCPYTIYFINQRIKGCISVQKRTINPILVWHAIRSNEKIICESILPFIKIKKEHCELFLEFTSCSDIQRMYEITNKIKHLNSL